MTAKNKTEPVPVPTSNEFQEIRKLDLGHLIEKKNGRSYLSWVHALDVLLCKDRDATWTFGEPTQFGESLMVHCTVEAFGKSRSMHLPVMDHKNQAIKNPDARQVSDAMMRCLAKAIATFGIGLYIWAGSDYPDEEISGDPLEQLIDAMSNSTTLDELRASYQAAFTQARNNRAAVDRLSKIKDELKTKLEGEK
jgi:hypothetical protein